MWGLVSDSGWSKGDAKVICSQLGYSGGSGCIITCGPFFKLFL